MEKKEKLMWIKKAAEDQKRYEVGVRLAKRARANYFIIDAWAYPQWILNQASASAAPFLL